MTKRESDPTEPERFQASSTDGPPPTRAESIGADDGSFATGQGNSPPSGGLTDSETDFVRRRYGRYTIERTLGEGGFGRVYQARDELLKRPVALKIPRRSQRNSDAVLRSCKREAETVASLDLPGVVPIYDFGLEPDGTSYFVSRYLSGGDLFGLMERRSLAVEQVVEICIRVAETLHQVHAHSIVHRDIKPGNLLLDEAGEVFISDFGLALRPSEMGRGASLAGTLRYMSPEQVRGESHLIDGRSDLYSLGVIMYEMLSGQKPFDSPDPEEVRRRILTVDPKPLRQIDGSIPRELDRICLKSLSKLASDRFPDGQSLANDLSHWLKEQRDGVSANGSAPADKTKPVIVPRGLRAFRGRDSQFFLDLLPGPRGRDGLPDLVRQWKSWVDDDGQENEDRVGVIYGPSGCGKSSLIQAGIVPLLDRDVEVGMIQATSEQADEDLTRVLRRRCPPATPDGPSLDQMSAAELIAHRREYLGDDGKKLLLVIDQFEQCLLNDTIDPSHPWVSILRQCDGKSTQAILLVRDDFWVELGRLMAIVEIPLNPELNCTLIDLFDPAHARRVLADFGRAYKRLPESGEVDRHHEAFLDGAIDQLTNSGKVFPVQLALFAEMLKGRPWIPATLEKLGGVHGIGTQFLEETFEAEHATVKSRRHQTAVRMILESLLPVAGTNVRTVIRGREELLEISGYAENTSAFQELLEILVQELRLVSPVSRVDGTTNLSGVASRSGSLSTDALIGNDLSGYQLSHDFLIPSTREWVQRIKNESYRGRIASQMSEISSLWSVKREKRFLPNWIEWVWFLIFVRRRTMSPGEKSMMAVATQRHLVRTSLVLLVVAIAALGVMRLQRSQRDRSAVNQLRLARFDEAPGVASALRQMGLSDDIRITSVANNQSMSPERRSAAIMTSDPRDPTVHARLVDESFRMAPRSVAVVAEFFDEFSGELSSDQRVRVLDVFRDPAQPDQRRITAAQLLARCGDPESVDEIFTVPDSESLGDLLVRYAAVRPSEFNVLRESFAPIHSRLIPKLSSWIGDLDPSPESSTAVNFIADFLVDDPEKLADLALSSSPWQLAILTPGVLDQSDRVIPFLMETVEPHLGSPSPNEAVSTDTAVRAATAAAMLIRLSDANPAVWNLLRFSPHPTLRRTLIERFHHVEVPRDTLLLRFHDEVEPTITASLMLAIGEYPAPTEGVLASQVKDKLLRTAVSAREPGTMAAARWLIKKWGLESEFEKQTRPPEDAGPVSPLWRQNQQGMTLALVDASGNQAIGRMFEISTMEITVDQYLKCQPDAYYSQKVSSSGDCPINVVRWHDAMRFCRWLSEQEGIMDQEMCFPPVEEIGVDYIPDGAHVQKTGYRLPTVAEWNYACRAGTVGDSFVGQNFQITPKYTVQGRPYIAEAGISRKPNDLGLFHMFGNVMEWTADIGEDGESRRLAGGSYSFSSEDFRLSLDRTSHPETKFNSIGFRIVRTIKLKSP